MKTFIVAAITVDGFIGRDESHQSLEWTSTEDTRLFVELTKKAGVMILGSRTFATIGRGLPGRKMIVYTRTPEKITGIADVEATAADPADLIDKLTAQGYESAAICGGQDIYTLFFARGLVDELYITVEPYLLGDGIRLFGQLPATTLNLLETRNLNEHTVLLHYAVKKAEQPAA